MSSASNPPPDSVRDDDVLAARPSKLPVDARRPYAMTVEQERAASGAVEPVATLFLTNRECPFRCTMCDLWRHTLDEPTPPGAIPEQIEFALRSLPPARHIKLYNSGNFFDRLAVPPEDHATIAAQVKSFRTVIVECHPRLVTDDCLRFRDRLADDQELEVAMGLETVHPRVLPLLNKRMTTDDYAAAARRLTAAGIAVRSFVLLRPPTLTEEEGIEWARRSIDFAFDVGARVVSVIPTRAGNGLMERWRERGWFVEPSLESLETVVDWGVAGGRGRVFADLWDVERFAACLHCRDKRRERLARLNLNQKVEPRLQCTNCENRYN